MRPPIIGGLQVDQGEGVDALVGGVLVSVAWISMVVSPTGLNSLIKCLGFSLRNLDGLVQSSRHEPKVRPLKGLVGWLSSVKGEPVEIDVQRLGGVAYIDTV
jgi:hypothetical protein